MHLPRVLFILLIACLPASTQAGKNIFDDDWVAPKPSERPAPKPAPAPATAPAPASDPKAIPAPVKDSATTPTPTPAPEIKQYIVPPKRLPVPPSHQQTAVRKVMKEVFAAQLTDRTIAGRKKLISALVAQADKSADVPTERFVLLAAAYDASIEAVDLPLAMHFADDLARVFEVDGLAAKAAAVTTLVAKPFVSRDVAIINVKAAMELASELTSAEDYAAGMRVCQAVLPVSNVDPVLRMHVQARLRDITALRDAAGQIASDLEKLKASPNDPAANLAVGRYHCLLKDNWAAGLPLLAKGSNAEFKALAMQEIPTPTDPLTIARLADGWWNLSGKQSESTAKASITAHAAALYGAALPGLTGLQRELATRRLADAAKLGPRNAIGTAVRTNFTVAADKSWQTVCEVRAGDVIVFAATGLVTTHGGEPKVGPEGQRGGRVFGCLRGQIGEAPARETFTIGAALRHVAGRDGILTLSVDDGDGERGDNRGEFKVTIDRSPALGKMPLTEGKSDQFKLLATDVICRVMKAGTYDISAEGEWSHVSDGALYGPEGRSNGKDDALIVKRQDDNKFQTIGKAGRLMLDADETIRFKIRDSEDGMMDNRGFVNVLIRPVK